MVFPVAVKFAPVKFSVTAAAALAEEGLLDTLVSDGTVLGAGLTVKVTGFDWPPGVVTVTLYPPRPLGRVMVTTRLEAPAETTVCAGASAPKLTTLLVSVAVSKPLPLKVKVTAAFACPDAGLTPVSEGAAARARGVAHKADRMNSSKETCLRVRAEDISRSFHEGTGVLKRVG